MSVKKSKAQKLIKAPKGKCLKELKNDYEFATGPTKRMLFLLIRKQDPKFKG